MTNDICIGLDLGQANEYTALAIVERVKVQGGSGATSHFHLRHLERFSLRTPYPTIADRMFEVVDSEALTTYYTDEMLRPVPVHPELVVDQTGLGAPACDFLKERGLSFRHVVITGSEHQQRGGGAYRVPKADLVALASAGGASAAGERWAAVAYAPSITQGHAADGFTLRQAKRAAIAECENYSRGFNIYRDDCQGAVWVRNGWAALAYERTLEGPPFYPQWAWGWGHTRDEAANHALRYCQQDARESCELDDIDPGGYTNPTPAHRTPVFDAAAQTTGGRW